MNENARICYDNNEPVSLWTQGLTSWDVSRSLSYKKSIGLLALCFSLHV